MYAYTANLAAAQLANAIESKRIELSAVRAMTWSKYKAATLVRLDRELRALEAQQTK